MPSTTTYERGQVVVVNVPFTGQAGSKPRPALVVSVEAFHRKLLDVIVCPISSQPRYYQKPGPGDHALQHWKAVGLRHPSTARISNILAVEKKLIKRVLGKLHHEDLARIECGLREAFGLGAIRTSARPIVRPAG
jgi:mRNA interferase MazF